MSHNSAEKIVNTEIQSDLGHWTKLERSFLSERVRTLLQLPPALIRAQVRDLAEHAPRHLLSEEVATTIYLAVVTPESNSLESVVQIWEALELPLRRAVRVAFHVRFGGSIREIIGHRLPPHLRAVLSW